MGWYVGVSRLIASLGPGPAARRCAARHQLSLTRSSASLTVGTCQVESSESRRRATGPRSDSVGPACQWGAWLGVRRTGTRASGPGHGACRWARAMATAGRPVLQPPPQCRDFGCCHGVILQVGSLPVSTTCQDSIVTAATHIQVTFLVFQGGAEISSNLKMCNIMISTWSGGFGWRRGDSDSNYTWTTTLRTRTKSRLCLSQQEYTVQADFRRLTAVSVHHSLCPASMLTL